MKQGGILMCEIVCKREREREREREKAHVFGLEQYLRGLLVHRDREKRLDPNHPNHKLQNPCFC